MIDFKLCRKLCPFLLFLQVRYFAEYLMLSRNSRVCFTFHSYEEIAIAYHIGFKNMYESNCAVCSQSQHIVLFLAVYTLHSFHAVNSNDRSIRV